MVDIVSKKKRSQMMAGIRGKNTKPEIIVRRLLFAHGYRFRINKRIGSTRPDIVLPKWNLCIFVHGCFWHRHEGCKFTTVPKSNTEFWENKFAENKKRDIANVQYLRELGWKVGIIWECSVKSLDANPEHFLANIKCNNSWNFP